MLGANAKSEVILDSIRNYLKDRDDQNVSYVRERRAEQDANRAANFEAAGIGNYEGFMGSTGRFQPSQTSSQKATEGSPERASAAIGSTLDSIKDYLKDRDDQIGSYARERLAQQDANRLENLAGVGDYRGFMRSTGRFQPSQRKGGPKQAAAAIEATYEAMRKGQQGGADGGTTPVLSDGGYFPGYSKTPAAAEIEGIKLFQSQFKNLAEPEKEYFNVASKGGTFDKLLGYSGVDPNVQAIGTPEYNKFISAARSLGARDIPGSKAVQQQLGIRNIDSLNDLRKIYDEMITNKLKMGQRFETEESKALSGAYEEDQAVKAADVRRYQDLFGDQVTKSEVEKLLNVEGQNQETVKQFLDDYMNTYGGAVTTEAYDLIRQ
jgi:hypothetical protein